MSPNPPLSFVDALHLERRGERLFARVPGGWEQGRGAYGGVVVGLAIRGMETAIADLPPLRALSAEIPSPLITDLDTEVRVALVRRGKSLVSAEARLLQRGETVARATGLFGDDRPVEENWAPTPPPEVEGAQPWERAPIVPSRHFPPNFVRHLEMRPLGMPFRGADEARVAGWVRFRIPPAQMGAAEVAALADAYYPGCFSRLSAPRPAATIAYSLHLTPAAQRVTPEQPLFFRSHAPQLGAGYSFEVRELWSPGGELVAYNPQTFAVIR